MEEKPKLETFKSFEEFSKWYWYRDELIQICKELEICSTGTKNELLNIIQEYFKGNIIKKKTSKQSVHYSGPITLETKILECGFTFSQKFREFFSDVTGKEHFKFNTDMVATVKKVKETKDINFTLKDLLDVYYGKLNYAKYDHSACQWNKFLKDFSKDPLSNSYKDKLKVASILWTKVRDSLDEKIYTSNLIEKYDSLIQEYKINE
ncbi:MAG: SAP domain-containing protein, partial [Anaeroplasmataceae bacterium]|nr:SAP domain-containing protein [Anaeroplasmataceae bacterium]